jgi:hypothetical protein
MTHRPALLLAALLLTACKDSRGAGELFSSSSHDERSPAAARASSSSGPGAAPSPDDYSRHVAVLKRKVARLKGDFSIVIEPPFVVVGDCGEEAVRSIAQGTVRWTREKLLQDFFAGDPRRILDIWLFKGAETYEAYVYALTAKKPTTPYGFYSSDNNGLFMNIGTGQGTLVHELVHPYVEANFPSCPPWLNEGLGSLYEQCGERDGHIIGYTNWRLRGLKAAILDGRVPSFADLTAMDSSAYYGEGSGVHYAASRYLLYYLQERGMLVQYYRAFFEARDDDPTGYKTLVRVLGERDMADFERRWVDFVMGLSFP